ncbi:MAG: NAD(P)/FAD-dependent oxidoreductase [Acidobacteriia bacterium]|nr:NAD(P)/FAD-dependent oxidoreductase [Terriglobia bacterium]
MRDTSSSTVTIAGAGPSGLAAAIALGRAGHKVRVLERAPTVGTRFHDDFQGIENWTRAEDALEELSAGGIARTFWARPFEGGTLFDRSRAATRVRSGRPLFYVVRRGTGQADSLDRGLLRQALEVGVRVEFGTRADPSRVEIDASGPGRRPMAVARGITFPLEMNDSVVAILDDALAPGGYVYFLVADRQATLATVLFRDFARADHYLDLSISALESLVAQAPLPRNPRWSGHGSFGLPPTLRDGGGIRVGEAAGFQDLLFGFGIRSAMVSGVLAARSILHGYDYQRLWLDRLMPHMKAAVVNRAVYSVLGNVAKVSLCSMLRRTRRPEDLMRRLYAFTPVHRVLFPLVRPRFARAGRSSTTA